MKNIVTTAIKKSLMPELADSMVNFINDYLLDFSAVYPLDVTNRPRTKEIRGNIRAYHKDLAQNGEYSLKSAVKVQMF